MPTDPKILLWSNLVALMEHHWGEQNINRLHRESGVAASTITRIKQQRTSVGLDVLEQCAGAFGLQPWQLLVPNLDPGNPPHLMLSPHEREFYEKLKAAAKLLSSNGT